MSAPPAQFRPQGRVPAAAWLPGLLTVLGVILWILGLVTVIWVGTASSGLQDGSVVKVMTTIINAAVFAVGGALLLAIATIIRLLDLTLQRSISRN